MEWPEPFAWKALHRPAGRLHSYLSPSVTLCAITSERELAGVCETEGVWQDAVFVNKPKFQDAVLCVPMMNGKLHTSDFELLADLRNF